MGPERLAVRARVRGRVQGVFFRAWTKAGARTLGLDGWVRNRHDGSVEALLAGPPAEVEAMIARLRRGPPEAYVAGVEVSEEPEAPPAGFTVRPTG